METSQTSSSSQDDSNEVSPTRRRTLNEIETDVLTVPEAAKYLKVSQSTMRRLVMRKEVTSVQIGRNRRVTLKALRIYLQNLERQARQNG